MESVTFFEGTHQPKSGDIATDPSTVYQTKGLSIEAKLGSSSYPGTTTYDLTYSSGKVAFAPDGQITEIWGNVRFSHNRDHKHRCFIRFEDRAHGTMKLKNGKITRLEEFYGLTTLGCLKSKNSGFIKLRAASFDTNGLLTVATIAGSFGGFDEVKTERYAVELKTTKGSFQTFFSGDTVEIENGVVKVK